MVGERAQLTEGYREMKLKAVSGIMLTLLSVSMLTFAFNIQPIKTEPITIIVPDDYEKIQWAIGNASDGDTIFVRTGTYYENVVVNRTVSLIGENRSSTIVDGSFGTGFHVISDYVNISGFTIRNCGPPEGGPFGGIHLDSSDNCTISGNLMNDNYRGIWPDSSSNNTVFNNTFSNCSYAIGGTEMSGNNQKVFDNFMSANAFGIYLKRSNNSVISNNTILNSRRLSIYLQSCSNTVLTNNNMTGNTYSLKVFGGHLSHFIHDIDVSNTVDGKPVYYLINQNNLIIDPLTFPDIGYLGLVNSTNVIVRNLNLTRSGDGLLLAYTTRSTVMNLNVSFNSEGIDVFSSSNNTFTNNKITSNLYSGIEMVHDCDSNTIVNNTISNNGQAAISMGMSNCNIIKRNTLSNNDYGIGLLSCQENTIHHNNFINNKNQVALYQSSNTWDNGYPSGGNYWSDYAGEDLFSGPYQNETGSDGIGDTAYELDTFNQDRYPLMNPYVPLLGDLNDDRTVNILDVIILAGSFGSEPDDPNWNPDADLNDDGIINIFDAILIARDFGKTS